MGTSVKKAFVWAHHWQSQHEVFSLAANKLRAFSNKLIRVFNKFWHLAVHAQLKEQIEPGKHKVIVRSCNGKGDVWLF